MSRPVRAVFDTSTLIGAMLSAASVPRQAFMAALASCELRCSQETLAELDRVVNRAKFSAWLPLADRHRFVELYCAHTTLEVIDEASHALAKGVCRDPKDAIFLALAVASDAQVLISSDEDLLVLHGWKGLAIMKPADFLAALSAT
ncbi:MAG: putative toxin-antitoxin system toxin component, PIN family [Burkholderiaceae bacterium]|nr:putative toxin-antitoxin system toxin component, PIN family [Burkholderiaceae bacterium]